MTPLRRARRILAVLLFFAAGRAFAEGPAPITNEDVVRLVSEGVAEADIVAAIKTRPCALDVSEEMIGELGIAGVPPAIVAAMKARVAQTRPPAPPPERARRGTTRLVVTFASGGTRTLHAPAFADEEIKHRLGLPKENDARVIHDLAIFLACTTAEHVPDQWRQKSPLGRDMSLNVRHEMLAFVPGETPAGKKPRVAVPERLEADVDDTEPHDLVLGVAALVGDRWIQVAAGRLADARIAAGSPPLSGKISARPEALTYAVSLSAPEPPPAR